LLSLVVIAAGHFQLTWTYYFTKPMVMLMMLFFFKMESGGTKNVLFKNLMISGILFSAIGDFLLMFAAQNENYFIMGLIAFLITHICYTTAFISQIFNSRPWNQHWGQLAFSTLIVVYGAEYFILNHTSFGAFMIPVMIYCAAITAMGVAAVMRDLQNNKKGYFRVLLGALLFIVSDSLLATNKFVFAIDYEVILILGTYFAAQFFIITGCVIDFQKNKNILK